MNSGSEIEPRHASLKDRLKETARAEILSSAEAVFAEQGIERAKVEDIAQRTGVSVGTLYNYFGDRKGLLEAVFERHRSELAQKLDEGLARHEGQPFAARLEELVDVLFKHIDRNRNLFVLMMENEMACHRGTAKKSPMMGEVLARMERLIADGSKERVLDANRQSTSKVVLTGIVRGVLVRKLFYPDTLPEDLDARGVVDVFLNGCRRRA